MIKTPIAMSHIDINRLPFLNLLFMLAAVTMNSASLAREINFREEAQRIERNSDPISYEKFIFSLRPGDVLRMNNGEKYTIGILLGHGHQHAVFSIQETDQWALRLPYRLEFLSSTLDTLEGYEKLKTTSLRIVKIHPISNWEYVLAERVTSNYFTILDFLSERQLGSRHPIQSLEPDTTSLKHNRSMQKMVTKAPAISSIELQAMEDALIYFASSLSEFLQIHDLKSNQLIYDRKNKEWILLDWLHLIELYSPEYDGLLDLSRSLVLAVLKGDSRYLVHRPGFTLSSDTYQRWKRVSSRMQQALLEKRLKLRGSVSCQRAFTF